MGKFFKYIITFISLIIIFNLLLFITSLFPSSIIEKNVRESSDILCDEGGIYSFYDNWYVVNDNYTDALMINEAYSIDHKNPIDSYMRVRKNYKENQTKQQLSDSQGEGITINEGKINQGNNFDTVEELKEFLDGKTEISMLYARYWHGYLPVLRVALIFFNIAEIRNILLMIFIILLIYSVILIKKRLDTHTAIIFAYSLILEGFFFVSYSLECAPVFIIMMLACIILMKNIKKLKDFYFYIFIIACITNFVDYLTVPLITVAMPLYLYILYLQKENDKLFFKDYLIIIIKALFIWLIGYAITWVTKWVLYDLLYNEGLIKSAINQVLFRSNGNSIDTINKLLLFLKNVFIENICYIVGYLSIAIYIFIYKYMQYKENSINLKENIKKKIPVLVISILPFIWFIVLSNHTAGDGRHGYKFSYRNMLIFLFGFLLYLKEVFYVGTSKKKEEKYCKINNLMVKLNKKVMKNVKKGNKDNNYSINDDNDW